LDLAISLHLKGTDNGEFEKCLKEIYPFELELKQENGDDSLT